MALPIIGRRLPASSSFVLAGAPPGAPGSGRSSWTQTARRHENPAAASKAQPQAPPHPDGRRSPG